MSRIVLVLSFWAGSWLFSSCSSAVTPPPPPAVGSWHQAVDQVIPRLGHRNWLVVTDKAYPCQTTAGVEYIQANEKLLPVLAYVLQQLKTSRHVSPKVFCDRELSFITPKQVPTIDAYRTSLGQLLKPYPVHTIMHDSVFSRLAQAANDFKVVIIKTEETTAYSSVFMQLDCAYWNADKEAELRRAMAGMSNH